MEIEFFIFCSLTHLIHENNSRAIVFSHIFQIALLNFYSELSLVLWKSQVSTFSTHFQFSSFTTGNIKSEFKKMRSQSIELRFRSQKSNLDFDKATPLLQLNNNDSHFDQLHVYPSFWNNVCQANFTR